MVSFNLRIILVLSLLFSNSAAAKDLKDWRRLESLKPGAELKIELKQRAGKLKGTLVKLDDTGIDLELKGRATRRVNRTEIQQIRASDGVRKSSPLIGAAAGAAVLGSIGAQERFDFTPTGVLIVAGIGALIGFGIGSAFRSPVVYLAP